MLVCTRGRDQLITPCLEAAVAALGDDDELIVVEAETEAARDVIVQLGDSRCRWIPVPVPGKSRQLNLGIQAAGNEIVLITDDDCRIAPGWVEAMVEPFLEEDVGIAFGSVIGLSRLPGNPPEPPPPGPAPPDMWRFSHGAAMAIRRAAAVGAGGFDERLGPGTPLHGEEADLLLRIESAGWRCFVADAPPVQHLEWRTNAEDLRNLLVYERGGGAWIGAALRRGAPIPIRATLTRLGYQTSHLRRPSPFSLRAEWAFCSGLVAGLRLKPLRFLQPTASPAKARRAAFSTEAELARLPWPSIHGRRCLCLTSDQRLARELSRRGAGDLVRLEPARAMPEQLTESTIGRFDVVVADGLLAEEEPLRWLHAVAAICDSHLLSIERLHAWLTILGRRSPYAIPARDGRDRSINGSFQRQQLENVGFRIQLVSEPYLLRPAGGPWQLERAVLARRTAAPAHLSCLPTATRVGA